MKSGADSSHAAEFNRVKGQIEVLQRELKESFIGNDEPHKWVIIWAHFTS